MARDKALLNVAVIGHTQAGKSTIAGFLAARLTGKVGSTAVGARLLDQLAKDARSLGRGTSAKWALVMDTLKSEREQGRSSDIQVARVDTGKVAVTLTDVPGHRDFVKNAITGLSYADAGLLVVDASPGAYDAGIGRDGMARLHCQLAYTTGVRQMVVAVNKMDVVEGDQMRFEDIKKQVTALLKKIGFNSDKVAFVPTNAASGDNLASRPQQALPWYSGPTVVEALEALELPKRLVDRPLRLPIQDVFRMPKPVGQVVCGRIEAGTLKKGAVLTAVPSGRTLTVKAIQVHGEEVSEAFAGDNVGISFSSVSDSVSPAGYALRRGIVLCGTVDGKGPGEVASFQAQVMISHPTEVGPGFCPVLDVHTAHVACRFQALVSKLDRKTGKEVEASPRSLRSGDVAVVELVPTQPLMVEAFGEYPALGRFALRDLRQVVGLGVVKSVTRKAPVTKAAQAKAAAGGGGA